MVVLTSNFGNNSNRYGGNILFRTSGGKLAPALRLATFPNLVGAVRSRRVALANLSPPFHSPFKGMKTQQKS